MATLPKVNPGDIVRIVAPAGRGNASNLIPIQQYVESIGLVPVITPDIYDPTNPFYSNSDEFRANDLISALLDPEVAVIWCIRGGSGCIRLISALEAALPPSEDPLPPKLFIGYSDITVLHSYFAKKYNWATIHGPMLDAIVNGGYDPEGESVQSLLQLMFNQISDLTLPELVRLDSGGPIVGLISSISGGNLTVVETSIGTSWQIQSEGKLMFLEDVGEAPYRLERSLDHMKQANVFNGVDGVIFGDFTNTDAALIAFVLERFASSVNFPVFRVQGIGHGAVNIPVPFNTRATLDVKDSEAKTYTLRVDNVPMKK